MAPKPTTRIRGIRTPIPKGHLVGRSEGGDGSSHPIRVGAGLTLSNGLLVANASTNPADVDINGFGFSASGLLLDKELLGIMVFGVDITFPSAIAGHAPAVECATGPVNNAIFYIVPLLAGVDQAPVCAIEFLAGATTASITWTPATYTMKAGVLHKLYAPSPADTDLWIVSGWIPGDVA